MKFKDYYKILGVQESATQDEIKRAYRKKARQYHPDVSQENGAEEKFKEIGEAYEALKDEKRRAEYDQLKKHGFSGGDDFRRPNNWQGEWQFGDRGFAGSSTTGDHSDFFESIFGASMGGAGFGRPGGRHGAPFNRGGGVPGRGADVRLLVRVDLNNAYHGGKTSVSVPQGAAMLAKKLSVKIPAGVVDGQQLRLRGQGRAGVNGGVTGDLILTIALKRHEVLRVEGADVHIDVPITPLEAYAGAKISVPTLGGTVSVNIAPKTRSGSRVRLRGRGLPATPAGDQFLTLQIQLPAEMSQRAVELLGELDDELQDNPRETFIDTVLG